MSLYALAIFVAAFLLFMVQPLIAKIILPWFGGSAAVWISCLLFFQVVLVFGYLYAYWLIERLRPRAQRWLHVALLGLSLAALPGFSRGLVSGGASKPSGLEDPTLRILGLLAAIVGLPYFFLSSTSPLLQAWYARARRGVTPYRLFALSNTASLLALLSYPVLVEPFFSTRHQAGGWSVAYVCFSLICVTIALGGELRGSRESAPSATLTPGWEEPLAVLERPAPPAWGLQLLWLALAACASTLLLAITNYITQNIATVPLLWVLPLGLYLVSFIVCFREPSWYRRDICLRFLAVALGGMAYALAPESANLTLIVLIPLYCAGLFLCCLVCHGELARLRPLAAHLTSFYLAMSMGGALGGLFVGLLAPRIFRGFFELPVAMAGFATLLVVILRREPSSFLNRLSARVSGIILAGLAGLLVVDLAFTIHRDTASARLMVRSFYGSLRVIDLPPLPRRQVVSGMPLLERGRRKLMNGSIDHGLQFLTPDRRRQPTTYYGVRSGAALAIAEAQRHGPMRMGVIGLGVGTLATYGRAGDSYEFYELNQQVIDIARSEFSFIKDSAAEIEIVPGDARLSLERQPPQQFDVLAVDAFTGDAIPVHLLTLEAFRLYFHHLRDGGVVAVHITNRYLDLRSVVEAAAQSLGKTAMVTDNDRDDGEEIFRARWVLVSSRREFFDDRQVREASTPLAKTTSPAWTDDYSNLFGVLKKY